MKLGDPEAEPDRREENDAMRRSVGEDLGGAVSVVNDGRSANPPKECGWIFAGTEAVGRGGEIDESVAWELAPDESPLARMAGSGEGDGGRSLRGAPERDCEMAFKILQSEY